jgi:hypothetical protein
MPRNGDGLKTKDWTDKATRLKLLPPLNCYPFKLSFMPRATSICLSFSEFFPLTCQEIGLCYFNATVKVVIQLIVKYCPYLKSPLVPYSKQLGFRVGAKGRASIVTIKSNEHCEHPQVTPLKLKCDDYIASEGY